MLNALTINIKIIAAFFFEIFFRLLSARCGILSGILKKFFKNAVEKKPQCALYIAIEDDVLDEEKVTDFEKAVEK